MRRVRLLSTLPVLALALTACDERYLVTEPTTTTLPGAIVGSGVTATQARPVPAFDAVTVTGPLRVVFEQGPPPSLEVTADDNVVPLVQSEVRGGRLFLGLVSPTSIVRAREIVCRVTTERLRDVDASGAARLELAALEADRLGVRLSGASTASGSGATGELVLDVSGASRWTGPSLQARAVTADVSGASFALVRASDSLRANASGASTIEYLGSPAVVSTVSGASVVRHAGS